MEDRLLDPPDEMDIDGSIYITIDFTTNVPADWDTEDIIRFIKDNLTDFIYDNNKMEVEVDI